MDQQQNVAGTVSLITGITTWVLVVIGWCVSVLPLLSIFGIFFWPLQALCAIVAVVSGGVGYSQAAAMNGRGRPASIVGAVLGLLWALFQAAIFTFVFLMFGLVGVLAVIGAIADA